MAWDSVPWFVAGANHSVEVARLFAYAATSGAEGVILPDDLKVRALSTPGSQVRVAPGGAILLNRYAGGGQQSYVGRNPTQDNVAITATGSAGGRRDLIVTRVADPQYPGTSAPTDPNDFQYIYTEVIEDVPAGTTRARDLNLNYPAIELALLDIPANTATITNAMITDLRRVALPRKDRRLYSHALKAADGEHILDNTSTDGEPWPRGQTFNLHIPEWATTFQVLGQINGARGSSTLDQNFRLWVRIGEVGGSDTINTDWTACSADTPGEWSRYSFLTAASGRIPASMRGTVQPVRLVARSMNASTAARIKATADSTMALDIELQEAPV